MNVRRVRFPQEYYSVGDEPTCEFDKCERGIETASSDLVRTREWLSGERDGDGGGERW
jgi:hypothetical protein